MPSLRTFTTCDTGVVIDSQSAALLLAEGAICFDTDTGSAMCEGKPVVLPSGPETLTRPVLVCGSTTLPRTIVADHLETLGLPAWQVVEPGESRSAT